MKKALFIGGTGQISMAIVNRLAADPLWEVWLLNRGNRSDRVPAGVHQIIADINNEADVTEKIKNLYFDSVCEFIGFTVDHVERDYRLFKDKTRQYIFTSSASAYHKPAASYVITEGTALANPHWQYSRDKIACEEFLMKRYREEGFPVFSFSVRSTRRCRVFCPGHSIPHGNRQAGRLSAGSACPFHPGTLHRHSC